MELWHSKHQLSAAFLPNSKRVYHLKRISDTLLKPSPPFIDLSAYCQLPNYNISNSINVRLIQNFWFQSRFHATYNIDIRRFVSKPAFDKANKHILCSKLHKHGFDGHSCHEDCSQSLSASYFVFRGCSTYSARWRNQRIDDLLFYSSNPTPRTSWPSDTNLNTELTRHLIFERSITNGSNIGSWLCTSSRNTSSWNLKQDKLNHTAEFARAKLKLLRRSRELHSFWPFWPCECAKHYYFEFICPHLFGIRRYHNDD